MQKLQYQLSAQYKELYHGIVECLFLIGLKGILECALLPYSALYFCMVEFNGNSSFLNVLFELRLKAKVELNKS